MGAQLFWMNSKLLAMSLGNLTLGTKAFDPSGIIPMIQLPVEPAPILIILVCAMIFVEFFILHSGLGA